MTTCKWVYTALAQIRNECTKMDYKI